MDRQAVAIQTQVEHQMLNHIMEGLRITVGWQVEGADATRKLSTLRFVLQSFQRHLERLLALEEHEGYMDLVPDNDARLARMANTLKGEHQTFRTEAHRLVGRLEGMQNSDLDGLAGACNELLGLLKKIDAHSSKELALLHEAFGQDSGGGG